MENNLIDVIKQNIKEVSDKIQLKKDNNLKNQKLELLKLLKNNLFSMDIKQLNYGLYICADGNGNQVNNLIVKINGNKKRVIKLNKKIHKIKNVDYDVDFHKINKHGDYNISSTVRLYREWDDNNPITPKKKPYYIKGIGKFEFVNGYDIITNKNIFEFDGKKTYKNDNNNKFSKLLKILSLSSDNIRQLISYMINYVVMIEVYDSHQMENIIPQNENIQLINQINHDDYNNYKKNCNYIFYDINLDATEFKDIFYTNLNDYVKNNFIMNGCVINCIVQNFHNAFNNKYKKFKCNYEELLLLFNKKVGDDMGLSLKDVVNLFFKPYNLKLDVINHNSEYIGGYNGDKINNNITPNIMRIQIRNNHIELLNDQINKFDQIKLHDKIKDDLTIEYTDINEDIQKYYDKILYCSDSYYIPKIKNINKNNGCPSTGYPYVDDIVEMKDYNIINKLNDLCDIIKKFKIKNIKNKTLRCFYNKDLGKLLFKMYEFYEPIVEKNNSTISKIKIKIGKQEDNNNIIIQNVNFNNANDQRLQIYNEKTITKYYEKSKEITNAILNKKCLSTFNDEVLKTNEKYKYYAIGGYFGSCVNINDLHISDKKYNTIDKNKSYTYQMYKMNAVPVFSLFDNYKKYDNHEIQPYNRYIIKLISDNDFTNMLFRQDISACYGYVLLNLTDDIKYEILEYIKPYKLETVDYAAIIDELYNDTIDEDDVFFDTKYKKNIINIITGLMEKQKNKKSKTLIFRNYQDAINYKNKIGKGNITIKFKYNILNDYKFYQKKYNIIDKNKKEIKLFINDYYNDLNDFKKDELLIEYREYQKNSNEKLFILEIENEKILTSNFNPIKWLIYDYQRIDILNMCVKLKNLGYIFKGIKVDAVYVDRKIDINILKNIFEINGELSGYKIETNKKMIDTNLSIREKNEYEYEETKKFKIVVNELLHEKKYNHRDLNLRNLYIEEARNILSQNRFNLILAKHAGDGKSYIAINYLDDILKLQIACPFNKLAINYKKRGYINSITFNKLLSIKVNDDINNSKDNKYMINENITYVIIEEIFLMDIKTLTKLYKFMVNNPNVKFTATGDVYQLEQLGEKPNNVDNMDEYLTDAVNQLFNNQIYLKINKRMKYKKDRDLLDKIFNDLFIDKLKITDYVSYLKSLGFNDNQFIYKKSQITEKNALCYLNSTVNNINKYIHHNLIKIPDIYYINDDIKLYKGLIINAKKREFIKNKDKDLIIDGYITIKKMMLYVNNEYKILDIDNEFMILNDMINNEIVKTKINKFTTLFKLNYAATNHNLQGESFKDNLLICDINLPYINNKWIYVMITRVDEFKKLRFLISHNETVNIHDNNLFKRYILQKINGYKLQDNKKRLKYNEIDYINVDEFLNMLNNIKSCYKCNDKYDYEINNDKITSNISLNRLDNSNAHIIKNVELMCVNCNKSLSNNDNHKLYISKDLQIYNEKIKISNEKKNIEIKKYKQENILKYLK